MSAELKTDTSSADNTDVDTVDVYNVNKHNDTVHLMLLSRKRPGTIFIIILISCMTISHTDCAIVVQYLQYLDTCQVPGGLIKKRSLCY